MIYPDDEGDFIRICVIIGSLVCFKEPVEEPVFFSDIHISGIHVIVLHSSASEGLREFHWFNKKKKEHKQRLVFAVRERERDTIHPTLPLGNRLITVSVFPWLLVKPIITSMKRCNSTFNQSGSQC
jgi:hypothetical protein